MPPPRTHSSTASAEAPAAPFARVPKSAEGHFVLCLYAAIFRLLAHVHRMCELAGTSYEELLGRYPFLARYFDEMRSEMPEGLTWGAATGWWREQLAAWESTVDARLPLRDLAVDGGIGFRGRLAFMIVGLVEEDSRFGTLLAELQEPLAYRRPTLELVGQVLGENGDPIGADAWEICRPLITGGLLATPDPRAPRAEWALCVPPVLWDAARGQRETLAAPWCRIHALDAFAPLNELIYPRPLLERLTRLPGLLRAPGDAEDCAKARALVLRSPTGGDPLEVAAAVAAAMGRTVIEVAGEAAGSDEARRLLAPLATLTGSVPFLSYDLAPGETASPPALAGYHGALVIALGLEGGLAAEASGSTVSLALPVPDRRLRRQRWHRALDGAAGGDLETIADRFHFGGGHIRRAAAIARGQAALDGRRQVVLADVRHAARALNRQLLDNLASQLEATGSWSQLICGRMTGDKLAEVERRCRHRERLLDHLGRGFRHNANRGVRALFTGASGTGKTYAARILAAELGTDLYRVDLASVVNKYIGETEKNLHRVLSHAEALDVLLLLDEGDALLGSRTEVRSANDRYANLETNYLLQRLESYQGVVVVATNLGDNIDSAFQRRMDVVVPFLLPTTEERWRILELHLPEDHLVPTEVLDRVATACQLSGGQLRNTALHASLLALDEGATAVAEHHLMEAVASEYRKAGAAYPLSGHGLYPEHGGVEAFIEALAEPRG